MGDRATILVKTSKGQVGLYTHWRGSELPNILKTALTRRQRWNDPSYLARIIFCEMLGGNTQGETGFGIQPKAAVDGITTIVDVDAQTVTLRGVSKSFEDFIK